MNTNRIEIPLTLAPPRFEDESTVATARQVKPIGRAKVAFRLRRVGAMLPLLLAATLCGALGAFAVNYYERRGQVQSTAAPETSVPTAQTHSLRPSSDLSGDKAAENPAVAAPAKDSSVEIEATKKEQPKAETDALSARRDDELRESAAPKTPRNNNADPAKLTRQRRVRPADEPVNKNGAGRIVDLFSGPNP